MPILTTGLSWIDLEFLGRPHVIATGVVRHAGDIALVDPGPSTCLHVLERELLRSGIPLGEVTQVLLTHIHLDHAGATGALVRRYPHIRVKVHERGVPHLCDPTRLVQSASRLYGDEMDRLWGPIVPVPGANVEPLAGGERIEAGGRAFEVAYTPGHASHHVSYFDPASGVAFVGDTAGVCVDGGYVLPPTPPPDIDLERWRDSIARLEAWAPSTLFLTHFGPVTTVRPHLAALLDHLDTLATLVRQSLVEPGTDEARAARVASEVRRTLRREMSEAQAAAYEAAAPFDLLWLGLARYWRKRGIGDAASQPNA